MGQVPGLVYGIVGDGRLARHFAHYLTLESIPFQQWSRRIGEHERVSAEARLAPADVLLVLLRDNAIETWIERHPELRGRPIVHCSGSLVTELAVGFHPLMTFGPELYDLETYRSIPFICEAKQGSFQEFFPRRQNPHHLIQPELKSLYHSLCVMSGNFTTILWQKFFHDLEHRLGLPYDVAIPYLHQISRNLIEKPEAALTGPLQRRDSETLMKNMAALSGDPFKKIYESFVEALAPGLKTELPAAAKPATTKVWVH